MWGTCALRLRTRRLLVPFVVVASAWSCSGATGEGDLSLAGADIERGPDGASRESSTAGDGAHTDSTGEGARVGDAAVGDAADSDASHAAEGKAEDARVDAETASDPDTCAQDAGDQHAADPSACACDGPTVLVTVNSIPASMNGSQPFTASNGILTGFSLALPASGFSLDVSYTCPCGCDPSGIHVSADVGSRGLPPGADLAGFLTWTGTAAEGSGSWLVPGDAAFAETSKASVTATAVDLCGNESASASLSFRVVELTALLHPFDIPDPWLITWHRDHYAIGWEPGDDGKVAVHADPGADGNPDLLQDLWLLGLGTAQPTPEFAALTCGPHPGGNECIAWQLLQSARSKMYTIFECGPDGSLGPESVLIRLHLEGEDDAPDPATFAYQVLTGAETEKAFSMIGLGGGDLSQTWIGMSQTVDKGNRGNEDNAKLGYGMFTTSLVRFIFKALDSNPDLMALAALVLSDIVPAMGGAALGELPEDHLVADPSVPASALSAEAKARRMQLETEMEILAAGLAALAVHEIGHSLGLDAKGPPPTGLFGGEDKAEFCVNPLGCVGAHLDTEGPNVMAAGPGSGNAAFDIDFLMKTTFFTPLEMAYFRGRIVLLEK